MSQEIFPDLPGRAWNAEKTPIFSTTIKGSPSGYETRVSYRSSPIYRFRFQYNLLRTYGSYAELGSIAGLFKRMKGAFDTFLYADDDLVAENEPIGIGNGIQTQWPILITRDGVTEQVFNISDDSDFDLPMWSSDDTKPMWTNDNAYMWEPWTIEGGTITFNQAPEYGVVLEWTGTPYYRCRFSDDSLDFTQFAQKFWKTGTVEILGSLNDRI